MDELLRHKLRHTLVEHDRKESAKRFYNPNALGIYMEALQSACGHFNGRLLAKLLKAAGCSPMTKEDNYGGMARRERY